MNLEGLSFGELIRLGIMLVALGAAYAGLKSETTRLVEGLAEHKNKECHSQSCVAIVKIQTQLEHEQKSNEKILKVLNEINKSLNYTGAF